MININANISKPSHEVNSGRASIRDLSGSSFGIASFGVDVLDGVGSIIGESDGVATVTGAVAGPPYGTIVISKASGIMYADYTYRSDVGALENNPLPLARNLSIAGTPQQGQVLTASFDFISPSRYAAGVHTYQWYRADDIVGTNEASIGGATASTYTCTVSDVNKYLRVKITSVQSAVSPANGNPSGSATYSLYTTIILSSVFDPTALGFGVQLRPVGMSDNGTTLTWTNEGSWGGSVTGTGATKPTLGSGKITFVSGNEMSGATVIHTSTGQYEVWLKGTFAQLATQSQIYSLGLDTKKLLHTTGSPKKWRFASTTTNDTTGTPPADTSEHIWRMKFDGSGGASITVWSIGNNTPIIDQSFTAQNNVGLVNGGTLKFGRTIANTLPFSGEMKHYYIYPNGNLSATNVDNMRDYLQSN